MKTFIGFKKTNSGQLFRKLVTPTICTFLIFKVILFSTVASAQYTIAAGATVNANTITTQSGVLTINGTLLINSNVNLALFTSVVINAPSGRIFWENNSDLIFAAGTGISIASNAPGCQPTAGNGNASQRLIVGSTTIAVSSNNSSNAAFSFDQLNRIGGLPRFTLTAGNTYICNGTTTNITVAASLFGNIGYDYSFSANSGTISPSSITNSTSSSATVVYTPATVISTVTNTITCNVRATGDADILASVTVTVRVGAVPTVSAGSAMATICQSGTSGILGGSFTGSATGAVWSAPVGTVNNAATPSSATYSASATSGSPVTLTLTTTGGCSNVSATKNITVNPLPTVNVGANVAAVCQNSPSAVLGSSFGGAATSAVWSAATGTFSNNTGTTPGTATYTPSSSSPSSVTLILTTAGGLCNSVSSSKIITVNPLPNAFTVTGGGTTYSCESGSAVGLSSSQAGINYQLFNNNAAIGSAVAGTGSAVTFGNQATEGTYTATGTSSAGCNTTMTGSAIIVITPVTSGTAIWTGKTSSDWCNTTNWVCGILPNASTNAIIPAGTTNMPSVNCANAYVKDLTLQGSATLNILTNNTLNLYGALVNTNQSQYTLNGTINFAGGNQIIPALSYYGVVVSGVGSGIITKTLAGNVNIRGSLTLIRGVIESSSDKMLTLEESGSVTAGSDESYVKGPVTRFTKLNTMFEFPVGKASSRSVYVTPQTNSLSSYTVTYYDSKPTVTYKTGNVGGILQNEYWEIKRNSGADAVISLLYNNPGTSSAWTDNISPCSDCVVAIVQGITTNGSTTWNFAGGDAGGFTPAQTGYWYQSKSINSKSVSSFGQFTFGFGLPVILPVTLIDFNGNMRNNDAVLEWEFASVNDLPETELELSQNGKSFSKLAAIPVTGNRKRFQYTNTNQKNGANFYRLKIKDKNGTLTYSKTVLLVSGVPTTIIKGLRPTMVQHETFADIHSAKNQTCESVVYDMAGRAFTKQKNILLAGENIVRFNTNALQKGVYSLQVRTEDGIVANLRFVKQ